MTPSRGGGQGIGACSFELGGEAGGAEAAGGWVVGDGVGVGELGAPAVGAGVAGEESAALGAGELHEGLLSRGSAIWCFVRDGGWLASEGKPQGLKPGSVVGWDAKETQG